MQVKEYRPLSKYTTMRLGGEARYLVEVHTKNDLVKAVEWADTHKQPIKVIGGGSNLIVTDGGYNGLIIINQIRGITAAEGSDKSLLLTCGGGEKWDDLVGHSAKLGLTGIEALSLIPGTVGATPVQNVGAYGQEVSDTIVEVEVYDIVTKQFRILDNETCEFGYRDSIFKTTQKDKLIITGVTFNLKKGRITTPLYQGLSDYLDENDIEEYSPQNIRDAVINIRMQKLPDPEVLANTGSFFKNPILAEEKFSELQKIDDSVRGYHVHGGIKVSAGWLLDQVGVKGMRLNSGMGVFEKHALVLVNHSANDYHALDEIRDLLISKVSEKFNITLEQEPETLTP